MALEKSLESEDLTKLTYADVVEELEKLEAPVEYAWGVVGHLMGVKNGDELRASHGEMQPIVIQATTKLSQSLAIYKALEAVMEADPSLDGTQRRILVSSLQSMKLSGVALEGEQKEAFNANRMELADISTKFSNHVGDAGRECLAHHPARHRATTPPRYHYSTTPSLATRNSLLATRSAHHGLRGKWTFRTCMHVMHVHAHPCPPHPGARCHEGLYSQTDQGGGGGGAAAVGTEGGGGARGGGGS